MRNLLLVSTSTTYGTAYLEHCAAELKSLFEGKKEILFIPFARPSGISEADYTAKAGEAFKNFGFKMRGLHEFDNPSEAVEMAEGVFTGGGNTFLLLKRIYETGIFETLQQKVASGMPYMGTSAGTNIAGLSIGTTNDMPIVYPPSFNALAAVKFNLNPHYLDPIEGLQHMGETRETRINEFHHQNKQAVIGLREGSMIRVQGSSVELLGAHTARVFQAGKAAIEVSGSLKEFEID